MSHLEVFYTPPDLIDAGSATLRIVNQDAHHISRVLRHKPGDILVVVDGVGRAYWVDLTEVGMAAVTGKIERQESMWGEPEVPIGLIIPPLKGSRLDWVVEKGTELGAGCFLITRTRNSLPQPGSNRLDRWRRIALSAMKQCGRSILPMVESFPALEVALDACRKDLAPSGRALSRAGIIYAKMGKPGIADNVGITEKIQSRQWDVIWVAMGPEGDFSVEELSLLEGVGAWSFGLGNRRLRSDTAAVAALAQLNGVLNNT